MIIKSLIALVATSMLTMKVVRHFGQKQQLRRVRDDHHRHRDDMHRWEGEGGNLPPKPQR